ncbi:MAG: hypothetical protein ACREPI_04790 [Candidatus Dormibacterales bacterium]
MRALFGRRGQPDGGAAGRRPELRARLFWASASVLVMGAFLIAAPDTLASFNSAGANPTNVFSTGQVGAPVLNSATVGKGGTVTLAWTASSTPGVTYSVMRAQGAGSYSAVASGLAGLAYTDTLPGQGSFRYVIRAVVSGFSADSGPLSVAWTLPSITGWTVCDVDGLVPPVAGGWLKTKPRFQVFADVAPGSTPTVSVTANAGKSGSKAFAATTLAAGAANCGGVAYGYSSPSVRGSRLGQGAGAVWVDVVVTDALGDQVHSNAAQAGDVGADTTAPTISFTFDWGGGGGSGVVNFAWGGRDSGGAGLAGYQLAVYLAGTSTFAPQYPAAIDLASGSGSGFQAFNLTSGSSYDFSVQAVDNAGNDGPVSTRTGVTAP